MKTLLLSLLLLSACSSSRPIPDAYVGMGDGGVEDASAACPEGCVCFEGACLCNDPSLAGGECR